MSAVADEVDLSGPGATSALRRAARPTLVALSYLLLACLVYLPVWPLSSHGIIDCACSDPVQEVWFLHWTSWAIEHAHNPFFTYYMQAPHGANLALNTSFPLLGLLGMPITATAGPVATYNLLLRLALALSALAMYRVLRRYTAWWPAAYAGGLLFGFSPYMIGHAHRHLFLTFLPLLPLVIPVVDDWLVRPKRNPWVSGVFIGLLVAGEFLISPEVAALMVIASVLGLVVLAIRYRQEVRARLLLLGKGLASAAGVLLLVAGVPAYYFLFGHQRPTGPLHPLANLYLYHGDLVAPVVPTHGEALATSHSGANLVGHSVVENGFYLGAPLLLLLIYAVVRYRKEPLVLVFAWIGVIAFVFGLGRTLEANGHEWLGAMPFRALRGIPLLENIEPARLSLFIQFSAAIVLAIGLDRFRTSGAPGVNRTAIAAAAAVVALAPLIPQLPLKHDTVHVPRFFTTSAVNAMPQGTLALTYPYSRYPHNDPMLWQVESGMRFRIFGGEAWVPRPDGKSTTQADPPTPPNITNLLRGKDLARLQNDPTVPVRVRDYLRRYGVGAVLIDPSARGAATVINIVTTALNVPPERFGGMVVWLDVRVLLRGVPGPGH